MAARQLNLALDPYSFSVPEIGAAFAKRHFDTSWLDGVRERRAAREPLITKASRQDSAALTAALEQISAECWSR
jgi:hypothetical protein